MGVGGQHHAPAALLPGKTRYPLYRRLGRPQGRSGRVRKISPPPGFDPRTVQPVAILTALSRPTVTHWGKTYFVFIQLQWVILTSSVPCTEQNSVHHTNLTCTERCTQSPACFGTFISHEVPKHAYLLCARFGACEVGVVK